MDVRHVSPRRGGSRTTTPRREDMRLILPRRHDSPVRTPRHDHTRIQSPRREVIRTLSARRENSHMNTPRREESFKSLNGTLNRSNISNRSAMSMGSSRNFSYTSLKETALARRVLFEDQHFPAQDSALKMRYHNLIEDIEWKRPHEISKRPRFINKNPGSFEVIPGALGSTWLLPAFSSLTLAPTLIQKCIPDEQAFDENYAGIFRFRFWRFGEWIEMVIDDRLPTHNGKLLFIRNSDPNEFWAALFEKAYAKLYGSYAAVNGNRIHWALQDLTGGIADCFLFNDNRGLLQKMVDTAMERCTLLSATIKEQGNVVQQLPNGLVTGRAYNITGYAEYTESGSSAILIRLRNPWGTAEWIGQWSHRSPQWNTVSDTMKVKLGFGQLKPGEFWMPFEEFSNLFTNIELCHLPAEAWNFDTKLRHRIPWRSVMAHRQWRRGFNAGGSNALTVSYNNQFYMELTQQCNVVLSLMQKYRLLGETTELVPCGCIIFKAPQDRKTRLQTNHFTVSCHVASTGLEKERDIVRFFALPAGCYVIVPVTEMTGMEGKYLLRIYTDDKNTIVRELDDPDSAVNTQTDNKLDSETLLTLRKRFLIFCNVYEEIDGYGLRSILSYKPKSTASKQLCCTEQKEDFDIQRVFLSPETCKAAITIVDKGMNGQLTYDEFMSLFQRMYIWQDIFRKYAVSNGSVMDTYALRNAFRMAGFTVSNKILEALVLRFAAKDFINLEGFINCVVKLHVAHQSQGKNTGDKMISADAEKNKKYLQELLRTAIYS